MIRNKNWITSPTITRNIYHIKLIPSAAPVSKFRVDTDKEKEIEAPHIQFRKTFQTNAHESIST